MHPRTQNKSFYDFPVLYDRLKRPSSDEVAFVLELAARHAGACPLRILDPACGPGNWLAPFAQAGCHVIGNDLNEFMAAFAAQRFADGTGQIFHGDMFELELPPASVDLIIEASGVTSIMSGAQFSALLDRLERFLTLDGKIFLLVNFHEEHQFSELPATLWDTGERELPEGGTARLQYILVEDYPSTGRQIIRRIISTTNAPAFPAQLDETYPMNTWSLDRIRAAVADTSLEIVGNYDYRDLDTTDGAGNPSANERLLVLARHADRTARNA